MPFRQPASPSAPARVSGRLGECIPGAIWHRNCWISIALQDRFPEVGKLFTAKSYLTAILLWQSTQLRMRQLGFLLVDPAAYR